MHDKRGIPIVVGDDVVLRGKVVEANSNGDGSFCSVNVEVEGDWDGKGNTTKMWFSAKQVEVVIPVVASP